MLWVNLIMDTFAAMALSSLPADRGVLNDRPRNPNSHIINRQMLIRIIGGGLTFFVVLVGVWQLLWHTDITSASELMNGESARIFFTEMFDNKGSNTHLSSYEMGIFFSIFVLLQLWNLFNAKYFRTNRSLIGDIIDLFRTPAKVRTSYSKYFILILGVILLGQIGIVNYAYELFSVAPLYASDWMLLLMITSPALIIPDIVRFVTNYHNNK